MNDLLKIRDTIKGFFSKYDIFIMPALKFILAFFIFLEINLNFSYFELLNNVFILVILSLLCAILPVSAIFIAGALMFILHCFALSLAVGAFALCLLLLLVILLLRFSSKDTLAVILAPFAFGLNLQAAIPIGLGALRSFTSILAGISSVAVYCFIDGLPEIEVLVKKDELSVIELIQTMVKNFLNHKELILSCIVFAAVILIVHLLRTSLTKYIYLISTAAGAVLYLALREIGAFFLDLQTDPVKDLIGTLISFALILVISFVVYSVDYSRTKRLQFEDEEYYYFVKAVPKRKPDYSDESEEDEQ